MSLTNKNTTLEDFKNIKEIITTKYPMFADENIKSIFVKILPDADLISQNKSNITSGKTSHIACTGDSMRFFYSILGEEYVANGTLSTDNTFDLYIETSYLNRDSTEPFTKSKCTIWLNRKSDKNQIGLSKQTTDGNDFFTLRRKMHENDVLIFFKYSIENNLNNYLILLDHNNDSSLIHKIGNLSRKPKYYDSLTTDISFNTENDNIQVNFNNSNLKGINKIYFGAPGTGKSKYVSDNYYDEFAKRVTFHPEYTYNDFVGYIRPKVIDDQLTYSFSPGVFTEILLEALQNPNNMYSLIIEELNRANVSAVFGDLFQLLDRNSNGTSEYRINNLDIYYYLKSKLGDKYNYPNGSIGLPNNLNIIATMNTSDQNVFVMDTAFKRRWEFEYLKINFEDTHEFKDSKITNLDITWQTFVETINEFMMSAENSELMISEDKQIGPYFIKKEELNNPKKFGYKVLLYLWDDVFKMARENIFDGQIRTFTNLMDKFSSNDAIDIFTYNLRNKLKNTLTQSNSKDIEEPTNE